MAQDGETPSGLTLREVKELRDKAHKSFDRIWKRGHMSRKQAYKWLAKSLQMPPHSAHMSKMWSAEILERVIAVSDQYIGRTALDEDFEGEPPIIGDRHGPRATVPKL